MERGQRYDLLNMMKALGQEHRLAMVGMMSERAHTVGEMAAALDLSEPTVSHHIGRLREAGLLNLRMDGNRRFYSLNRQRVATFKRHAGAIDTPPIEPRETRPDQSWIDDLGWGEEAARVLYTYTAGRRLRQIPRKEKKLLVILRWLATLFQTGERYAEPQVNEILTAVHPDYASLRRYLVSYGFMHRQRGGGDYWLAPEDAGPA